MEMPLHCCNVYKFTWEKADIENNDLILQPRNHFYQKMPRHEIRLRKEDNICYYKIFWHLCQLEEPFTGSSSKSLNF